MGRRLVLLCWCLRLNSGIHERMIHIFLQGWAGGCQDQEKKRNSHFPVGKITNVPDMPAMRTRRPHSCNNLVIHHITRRWITYLSTTRLVAPPVCHGCDNKNTEDVPFRMNGYHELAAPLSERATSRQHAISRERACMHKNSGSVSQKSRGKKWCNTPNGV